jgi:hypothetical protein
MTPVNACQQIGPASPPAYDTVVRVVESAKLMATMEPVAIWAFMCLLLIGYIVFVTRQHRQYDKKVEEMRTKDAGADMAIAESIRELGTQVSQMKVIVDERIPRRNDHV